MPSIPVIMAWTGILLSEALDLVSETFMKTSGRFTNLPATGLAYLLQLVSTTLTIWCSEELDFFTMYWMCGILEDVVAMLISLIVFKEALTLSKILAVGLIMTGAIVLMLGEQEYDEDNERWAPWPRSWDEPLWGTGSKEAAISSYDAGGPPIVMNASFTTSLSRSDRSSSISSNSTVTSLGNDYTAILEEDTALHEL